MFVVHFPNIAFEETCPREQYAAGISYWKFMSVSALCRLQSAVCWFELAHGDSFGWLACSFLRTFQFPIRSYVGKFYSSNATEFLRRIFSKFVLAVQPYCYKFDVTSISRAALPCVLRFLLCSVSSVTEVCIFYANKFEEGATLSVKFWLFWVRSQYWKSIWYVFEVARIVEVLGVPWPTCNS